LFWSIVSVGAAAALVALLVGHLRLEFETYRLAADADRLTAEKARLDRAYDELVVERQVRQDAIDLERVATERLGLQPVQPGQVYEVTP
jgi:cell division protein FtsL